MIDPESAQKGYLRFGLVQAREETLFLYRVKTENRIVLNTGERSR